jgi:hypothetical protein
MEPVGEGPLASRGRCSSEIGLLRFEGRDALGETPRKTIGVSPTTVCAASQRSMTADNRRKTFYGFLASIPAIIAPGEFPPFMEPYRKPGWLLFDS